MMRLISEAQVLQAVEESFRDLSNGDARILPVVREPLKNRKGTFGIKSGELDRRGLVGMKAGGYWPNNSLGESNLTNHQSTMLLFDAETGIALAVFEANYLTEVRTAAAGAAAIRALSRPNSKNLGIIGTGIQARSQVEAALIVRPFQKVRLNARSAEQASALCAALSGAHPNVEFAAADREETAPYVARMY